MKRRISSFLVLLGAAVCLTAGSGSAWATTAKTAANTQIINTATLTFTIGSTTSSASASVSVLVTLVPSAPIVSISNPAATGYTGPNTPELTDSVTILSTANGPAKYTVTPSINTAANSTGASVTPSVGTDVWLGASVTSARTLNTTTLFVPSVTYATDAALNGPAQVNGLGIGDSIVFTDESNNTQTQTILNVSNPGTASGTATITLSLPVTVATGTPIYEQTSGVNSFNIAVKPGTLQTPGTFLTVDVKAEVSGTGFTTVSVMNSTASANANAGDPSKAPTNLNVWTSAPATVSITKYVRNASNAAANPAGNCSTVITGTSDSWCTSGVSGKSGDVLEYAVVAKNTAGDVAGNLAACTISDLLPPAFVTLACNGYNTDEDVHFIDTSAGVHNLKACGNVAGSWANWNPAANPNLLVYVGNGSGNGTPGAVPFGQQVTITYKATIK
ncbi:MAG TPA: hypothetical protein DCZ75_05375 [Geobacter sp.]|nr:hypothetical protein [Geobacter sp.]